MMDVNENIDLLRKLPVIKCPVCNGNNWNVDDQVRCFASLEDNNNVKLGGSVQPFIVINCNICGNTLIFNKIILERYNKNGK